MEDSAFVDTMAKEERQHKDTSTKAARVTALSVNIVHFKKTAVEQHKCQICNRPLSQQELQNFLQYQARSFRETANITSVPCLNIYLVCRLRGIVQHPQH